MALAALKTEVYERRNISQLSRDFDIDKATVRKRIAAGGFEPLETKSKETIYELTPRLSSLLSNIDSPFDEARLRKETADAETRELKLAQMRGELVSMAEAVELVQAVVGALYQEYAVRAPKRIAAKLAKTTNVTAIKQILKADNDRVMKGLRENFEAFVK